MKIVGLVIIFMLLVFSVVTVIIPGSHSYKQKNPVVEIGKEIAKPLAKVDQIAPELGNALDQVDIKLPAIPGARKEKPGEDKTLTDHSGAIFSNMDLPKANFAGSTLTAAQFNGALLDGAVLEGANGADVNFAGAHMAGANLTASVLHGDFSGAELRKVVARGGDFNGSTFAGGDLSFASFSGASLRKTVMTDVYGAGAIFVGANLSGANFAKADLTGARFERADLSGAKFDDADMKLVNLTGAILHGADLSKARNLTLEQLSAACADAETKLPGGIAGARC